MGRRAQCQSISSVGNNDLEEIDLDSILRTFLLKLFVFPAPRRSRPQDFLSATCIQLNYNFEGVVHALGRAFQVLATTLYVGC